MRGIAFWFFMSAAVYVLLGMILGIVMSASQDHTMAPVHAHLNLVGWASMGLFGLYYHNVPEAAVSPLARIHFWVATVGLWLLVPGIALAITGRGEILAAIASLIVLAAMVLFVVIVWRNRAAATSSAGTGAMRTAKA